MQQVYRKLVIGLFAGGAMFQTLQCNNGVVTGAAQPAPLFQNLGSECVFFGLDCSNLVVFDSMDDEPVAEFEQF